MNHPDFLYQKSHLRRSSYGLPRASLASPPTKEWLKRALLAQSAAHVAKNVTSAVSVSRLLVSDDYQSAVILVFLGFCGPGLCLFFWDSLRSGPFTTRKGQVSAALANLWHRSQPRWSGRGCCLALLFIRVFHPRIFAGSRKILLRWSNCQESVRLLPV